MEVADGLVFMTELKDVRNALMQVTEFKRLKAEEDSFGLDYMFDIREPLNRIRIEGTYLEEEELFDLRRLLTTITAVVKTLKKTENNANNDWGDDYYDADAIKYTYPCLHKLTEDVDTFPRLQQLIDNILDNKGKIKDTASVLLLNTRRDLRRMEGTVSAILNRILREAQRDGIIEKDVAPTMRDGRLVLPVSPSMKKKVQGIVHDESATGKTVFIEPAAVVEANNRIRDLENEERRELINILKGITSELRPLVDGLLYALAMIAQIDLIQAKTSFAETFGAIEPVVSDDSILGIIQARSPILALKHDNQTLVPLDITLTPEKRILIISGPNAGGKSVCLKTVGLLQYMLQMGLPIPVNENSTTCLFDNIFIDIGDEQSIENDLSTYSSHLLNMKHMMRHANARTLILIDEFGTGTEPIIGGAIAEAVLEQFCKKEVYGVITTHYQNLKQFAETHHTVANGAMLYDRHKMQPLYQLAIGQPGSSFAIDIARKIGLPEEVITRVTQLIGTEHIDTDKYLQDIARDKRYWENKRQNIHQQEKQLQQTITNLESSAQEVQNQRKAIIQKAKEEAEELLREANRRIENTIREIKEAQAEKENTKKLRQELDTFRKEVQSIEEDTNDEAITRKIQQILARRERHAKRMQEKKERRESKENASSTSIPSTATVFGTTAVIGFAACQSKNNTTSTSTLSPGTQVKMKGMNTLGTIIAIKGKKAEVDFNGIKTILPITSIQTSSGRTDSPEPTKAQSRYQQLAEGHAYAGGGTQSDIIQSRNISFMQQLDLRGCRADEAMIKLTNYIDDAILLGAKQVRILHGTGTGALRQLTRQYLATVPNVTDFRDEHVQFGGTGITVVEL
ncbi:MAG: Smr/MutS family protein [Bacteroidaceae bacterium]|nr:Smr/MutS family protein [Bacteroidaceae bacterium]